MNSQRSSWLTVSVVGGLVGWACGQVALKIPDAGAQTAACQKYEVKVIVPTDLTVAVPVEMGWEPFTATPASSSGYGLWLRRCAL